MNVETGEVYSSLKEALNEAERPEDVVEIKATSEQIERLQRKVKMAIPKKHARQRSRNSP